MLFRWCISYPSIKRAKFGYLNIPEVSYTTTACPSRACDFDVMSLFHIFLTFRSFNFYWTFSYSFIHFCSTLNIARNGYHIIGNFSWILKTLTKQNRFREIFINLSEKFNFFTPRPDLSKWKNIYFVWKVNTLFYWPGA